MGNRGLGYEIPVTPSLVRPDFDRAVAAFFLSSLPRGGNSFWSFKAFRIASLSADPRRFMARTRPSGAIRTVAGIARMRYVRPRLRESPPYTWVQTSAFSLVYFAGASAASSHDTPTNKKRGSAPKVSWISFSGGHLGTARLSPRCPEVEQDELAARVAELERTAVERGRREVGARTRRAQKAWLSRPRPRPVGRLVLQARSRGASPRPSWPRVAPGPPVGRQTAAIRGGGRVPRSVSASGARAQDRGERSQTRESSFAEAPGGRRDDQARGISAEAGEAGLNDLRGSVSAEA